MEVKLNKSNENPFYGMRNCLKLMQSVGGAITPEMLTGAYNECKTKEQKQMFYSLIFSIGDITARQHNIFKGKKRDSGGNANREGFAVVLNWMWNIHKDQFLKFLNAGLFEEYTCFDHLLKNRVQTKGKKVLRVHNILAVADFSGSAYLTNEYDESERITAQTLMGRGSSFVSYHEENSTVTFTDELENNTVYTYDTSHNITAIALGDSCIHNRYNADACNTLI